MMNQSPFMANGLGLGYPMRYPNSMLGMPPNLMQTPMQPINRVMPMMSMNSPGLVSPISPQPFKPLGSYSPSSPAHIPNSGLYPTQFAPPLMVHPTPTPQTIPYLSAATFQPQPPVFYVVPASPSQKVLTVQQPQPTPLVFQQPAQVIQQQPSQVQLVQQPTQVIQQQPPQVQLVQQQQPQYQVVQSVPPPLPVQVVQSTPPPPVQVVQQQPPVQVVQVSPTQAVQQQPTQVIQVSSGKKPAQPTQVIKVVPRRAVQHQAPTKVIYVSRQTNQNSQPPTAKRVVTRQVIQRPPTSTKIIQQSPTQPQVAQPYHPPSSMAPHPNTAQQNTMHSTQRQVSPMPPQGTLYNTSTPQQPPRVQQVLEQPKLQQRRVSMPETPHTAIADKTNYNMQPLPLEPRRASMPDTSQQQNTEQLNQSFEAMQLNESQLEAIQGHPNEDSYSPMPVNQPLQQDHSPIPDGSTPRVQDKAYSIQDDGYQTQDSSYQNHGTTQAQQNYNVQAYSASSSGAHKNPSPLCTSMSSSNGGVIVDHSVQDFDSMSDRS